VYLNDWMLEQLAQERRRDMMRQIEHDRLVKQVTSSQTERGHKFYHILDWAGRQFITVGGRLEARHAAYHRQSIIHISGG